MKRWIVLLLALSLVCTTGCSGGNSKTPPAGEPVNITVWTYYNGDTLAAFDALTAKFNDTVGKEQGIYVSTFSYGSVGELETSVLNSACGEAGADDMPDIFMAYPDTAYAMNQLGLLINIADYMSEDELALYVDSYLHEGDLTHDGQIKILPTAKSTEVLCLNKTDWDVFSAATGASLDALATMEGIAATAEAYYEWTDSLTDLPGDGKAFFGYDAMDNYILIGSMQLGTEIFHSNGGEGSINFDRATIRRLWDLFYVPFVKGYYSAEGRFRSDDVKTGSAIAYVGSSSSATYFPTQVITSDTESYPIEMLALPCPYFEGGKRIAVQQGAGMAVTKSTDRRAEASVEFLKWFTAPENNIEFSVNSGYLPVTKAGNDVDAILTSDAEITENLTQVITVAVDAMNTHELYTPHAFKGGTEARNILKYSLLDRASADREAVLNAIAGGATMEEALIPYLSGEAFENWYKETDELLQNCLP